MAANIDWIALCDNTYDYVKSLQKEFYRARALCFSKNALYDDFDSKDFDTLSIPEKQELEILTESLWYLENSHKYHATRYRLALKALSEEARVEWDAMEEDEYLNG